MKQLFLSITFIFFISIITGINTHICAQNSEYTYIKQNGIYLETYLIRHDFSEGVVSLNYERAVGKKRKTNIRVGVYPDFESTVSFPITVSWITQPLRSHHFEYGIGAVYRVEHFVDPSNPNSGRTWFHDVPAIMIPLMYRYQNPSGFYLRGGVNLFISFPILPSPSFSAGFRF